MSDQLPPVDYGRQERRKETQVPTPIALAVIGLGVAAMIWMVFQSPGNHAREKANQIKCASNLRQIGQAIQLYALDNQSLFPPDPQTIAATQNISLECFVCPSTADTRATKPDELPAHHSYLYVGADLSTRSKPECIVALDDPANHDLEGGNILFADGHIEFFDLPTIQLFLSELNAGRNPPATLTPTLLQAGAEQHYQKNWRPRMPQLKTGIWRIPTTQPANAPK